MLCRAFWTFVLVVCVASTVSAGSVTTLTFDPNRSSWDLPADYGSRYPNTPNISLAWGLVGVWAEVPMAHWPDGYGDLVSGVGYGTVEGYNLRVAIVPDDYHYGVVLRGFDLAGFGMDVTGQSVSLTGAPVLSYQFSGESTWNVFDGTVYNTHNGMPTHMHFAPEVTGHLGQTLILDFGPGWNVGIDNLSFEQYYNPEAQLGHHPEPATLLLLGTGLLGAVRFARRRAKA